MRTVTAAGETPVQSQPVPGNRGCLFFVKRRVLIIIVVLVALPILGFTYETVMGSGDAQRYPPAGQLVAVSGHKMHLYCTGQGGPTVVLESGAADYSLGWTRVQPELSKTTRVCSYDRAGLGWSDPGPEPRDPQQIATELHSLLVTAGISAPYVIVGHSIGGKYVRMFAGLYPSEVVGMVLVDARHESLEPRDRTPEQNARDRDAYRSSLNLYAVLGRLGVVRLFGVALLQSANPPVRNLPTDIQGQMALIAVQQDTLDTMVTEGAGGTTNDTQLQAATLGNMPLVVLTARTSLQAEPRWEKAQQAQTVLSTNSRWQIVEDSSHVIQLDEPANVISAVQNVIKSAQSGSSLTS
jgi:pimeloyl-ACP methyl ester carboxylesterase